MTIFGPIIDAADVEEKLTSHLKMWLPTYLAEVAEQNGLERGAFATPRSWTNSPSFELDERLMGQFPAILVVVPGLTETPKKEGDGSYRCTWGAGVAVVVQAKNADGASKLAKRYGAAIHTLLIQKKGFDPNVMGLTWEGEAYDDVPSSEGRNMASARVVLGIEYRHVSTEAAGPAIADPPHADPTDPYPPWPTVDPDKVYLDLTKEN
jgi:hypothetical protein